MGIGSISKTNVLSWLIVLAILAPFIIYAVPQVIGANHSLVVRSGSMEPVIPTGSVIITYPAQSSSIQEGDIITFESAMGERDGTSFTTHRVVGVERTENGYEYKTKGDNNEDADPGMVSEDAVVGEHGFTIPYLGYIISWVRTEQAFIALVIIPATLLILSELWNIVGELRGSKGAEEKTAEDTSGTRGSISASEIESSKVKASEVETSDAPAVGSEAPPRSEKKERVPESEHTWGFDPLHIALLIMSFIVLGASIAMLTGIVPSTIQQTESTVQLGPIAFGVVLMASMVLSMIILRFL